MGTKICLSISAYHEESWQPAWGGDDSDHDSDNNSDDDDHDDSDNNSDR